VNNLPSEVFPLLGTSALHSDGWLSFVILDELLHLLGEGRKKRKEGEEEKKEKKTSVTTHRAFYDYA